MSSAAFPQGIYGEFASNQRLVIGAAITFIHASVVITLFFENPSQWQFFVYASIPTLVTIIVPFLITRTVVQRFYGKESLKYYFQTLSESTGDIPEAKEIEPTPAVLDELPDDIEDPDSVKIVDEELFDHVNGEEFDPVDADTRGIVAMGFACLLIVPSALIVGTVLDGVITFLAGVLTALVALWLVLQQHRDLVELIEYTPHTINNP